MYKGAKDKLDAMIAEARVTQQSKYEHANLKIKWKCSNNHEFERSYVSAFKHTLKCPTCFPKIPHNKGKTGVSKETSLKMSDKKKGRQPSNKGKAVSLETRKKLSAINRGISLEDFDDFTTPESRILRNKFCEMGLNKQCFEKYNYTCEVCGSYGTTLNAHHKNSWKFYPEQRFELNNLVCVCDFCHTRFHETHGNGKKTPNTEDQWNTFVEVNKIHPQKIVLLTGAPGAGKSWIGKQLEGFYKLPMDSNKDGYMLNLGLTNNQTVLTEITTPVSTWFKRLKQYGHDVDLVIIKESKEVIVSRILGRGGKRTNSINARIKRMEVLENIASFVGTSEEVLEHLNKKASHFK